MISDHNERSCFLRWKECVLENPRSFYGCATLGPFQRTQSLTVANALRRMLLSQKKGIAITHVHIDGAIHEYTTLKGVRESIVDLLLNLKQIVLKNENLEKPLTGYIHVRGPGIVRALDLKLPPTIRCVDPDQYIATLTEDGIFSIKCTIGTEESAIHTQTFNSSTDLWVDPMFNPIVKVNYVIEPIEPVQTKEFYDLVHIELWTNGSVSPQETLYEAFVELKNMFSKIEASRHNSNLLMQMIGESERSTTTVLKAFEHTLMRNTSTSHNPWLMPPSPMFQKGQDLSNHIGLDTLNLPARIEKALRRMNIHSVNDLIICGPDQLKKIPGIGNGSIAMIQKRLKQMMNHVESQRL